MAVRAKTQDSQCTLRMEGFLYLRVFLIIMSKLNQQKSPGLNVVTRRAKRPSSMKDLVLRPFIA